LESWEKQQTHVSAVHNGADGETQGHAEFVSGGTTATALGLLIERVWWRERREGEQGELLRSRWERASIGSVLTAFRPRPSCAWRRSIHLQRASRRQKSHRHGPHSGESMRRRASAKAERRELYESGGGQRRRPTGGGSCGGPGGRDFKSSLLARTVGLLSSTKTPGPIDRFDHLDAMPGS